MSKAIKSPKSLPEAPPAEEKSPPVRLKSVGTNTVSESNSFFPNRKSSETESKRTPWQQKLRSPSKSRSSSPKRRFVFFIVVV